jgi:hypothetical protein
MMGVAVCRTAIKPTVPPTWRRSRASSMTGLRGRLHERGIAAELARQAPAPLPHSHRAQSSCTGMLARRINPTRPLRFVR